MIESAKDFRRFLAVFSAACITWMSLSYKFIDRIMVRIRIKKASKVVVIFAAACIVSGCAFAPLSSRVGAKTADQYQKAYEIGTPSADKIKASWPYVSGLIKASFGEDYKLKLSVSLQNTVEALDVLCLRKKLTDEEKGQLIGAVNRLEFLAGREFWDKYGSVILGRIKALAL